MLLDPVENWGLNALKGAAEAMDATAKKVTETAKHYQAVEDQIAQTMKGF
jgi:hypothetical protein